MGKLKTPLPTIMLCLITKKDVLPIGFFFGGLINEGGQQEMMPQAVAQHREDALSISKLLSVSVHNLCLFSNIDIYIYIYTL